MAFQALTFTGEPQTFLGCIDMENQKSIILIGGTSHVGKSTLAESLAQTLGWRQTSTDSLARHPGRPWRANPDDVPAHVREHYATLDVDQLMSSVLSHYDAMWTPLIEPLLLDQPTDAQAPGLVLEGSALLPVKVAEIPRARISAVWLTASPGLIRDRIHAESGYPAMAPAGRKLVDNFLRRTLAFNDFVRTEVDRLSLPHLEVDEISAEELPRRCLEMAGLAGMRR